MDPVTAIAAATAAWQAVQKGFEVARGIEDMAGDLARWIDATDNVKAAAFHARKTQGQTKSSNSEALEIWAAETKANNQWKELREFIVLNFGMEAWDRFLEIRKQVIVDRESRAKKLRLQAAARKEHLLAGGAAIVGLFICGAAIWALMKLIRG